MRVIPNFEFRIPDCEADSPARIRPIAAMRSALRVYTMRSVSIVILFAIAWVLIPSAAASQETSRSLLGKKHSISARLRQIRTKLRVTKRKQRSVAHQLWRTESRIRETRRKVVHTQTRLQICESRLDATRRRLEETRERLRRQNGLLSKRLSDMYTGEHITYINVLLNSTDIWTLLSRAYYIERIIASDVSLIRDIEETKTSLERDEALYDHRAREAETLRDALKQQQQEQSALAADQRNLLQDITHDRELLERAEAELKAESLRIEAQIKSMQRTPAGAKRLAQKFIGTLLMPVAGHVTSGFGYRMHPILHRMKFHTGVDISAHYGTSICAAADGVVIMAGWRGGYGNTVVIDHGGGVSTLYAHCSAILVGEGRKVGRGETIARVGSTGLSTGPHLHFERRQNGEPVNPF